MTKSYIQGGAKKAVGPVNRGGYWLDLADNGDHVLLRLMLRDEVLYTAKAFVKGGADGDELSLVQGISYAAHMIYKFAQQNLGFPEDGKK